MKKTITIAIFGALLIAYFISCKPGSDVSKSDLIPADGEIPSRQSLDQNWSYDESQAFWFTDQGARIMPYDWFVWLEQPDNEELFRNTAHMEMLGYLPEKSSKWNPAGLPIGFTKSAHNEASQPAALGLTCAACHTSQIDYTDKDGKTTKLLVEGAPTLANFNLFFTKLVAAVNNTYNDEAKFKRLADKVLPKGYEEKDLVLLKSEFKKVADALTNRATVNALPAEYPEDFAGHGRLDAFGEIENAGSAFALNDLANKNPPAAPVSYPFLWGTHQSDVVQWNASANNRTPIVGPISRNIGEVVGVFGDLQITDKGDQTLAYSSTVNYHGIGALEGYIKKLRSPRWQNELFGTPDADMVSQGKAIFEKQCASCHQVIAPEDEAQNYCANQTPINKIGTDPQTAMQIATHQAKTLILEGQPTGEGDATFGSSVMSIKIPVFGVTGLIKHNLWEVIKADYTTMVVGGKPFFEEGDEALKKLRSDVEDLIQEAITHSGKKDYKDIKMEHLNEGLMQKAGGIFAAIQAYEMSRDKCPTPNSPLVYKGRPLNGIWATAPYLHNGSVPNLAELLKAPADRMKTFKVGSRTFDAENVGFITTEGGSTFDTSVKGNSNAGHVYGTNLSAEEKKHLLEYMKTL